MLFLAQLYCLGELRDLCHILLIFILAEFSLILRGSLLVLLVLGDEVVHVGLGLGELHLVHALAGVPMKESLATEHGRELLRHTLEQLLDGGAVADESGGHLETSRRDVADRRLDVVRDPLDEVAAVLILHVQHLLVHLYNVVTVHNLVSRLASKDFNNPYNNHLMALHPEYAPEYSNIKYTTHSLSPNSSQALPTFPNRPSSLRSDTKENPGKQLKKHEETGKTSTHTSLMPLTI